MLKVLFWALCSEVWVGGDGKSVEKKLYQLWDLAELGETKVAL